MKKIVLTLACLLSLVVLASCANKGTYKFETGTSGTTRSTATVYYTLEDSNSEISDSLYAKICYKGKTTSLDSSLLTYDADSTTGNYVTFDDLDEDTDYDVIFYATYNSKKVTLATVSVKTSTQGTEENPYQITSYEQFSTVLVNDPSGYFVLANDIDFEENGVEPLFSSSTTFTGSFDGQGYTIKNFVLGTKTTTKVAKVDAEGQAVLDENNNQVYDEVESLDSLHLSTNYAGIFGYIAASGVVKNFTVEGAKYDVYRGSKCYMGLIAGYNAGEVSGITLKNCEIEESVTSSSNISAAALVGWNAAGGKISNCTVEGGKLVVAGKTEVRVGAITGTNGETSKNKSTVTGCTANIEISVTNAGTSSSTTSTSSYIGGIVGENIFTISGCAFKGSIGCSSTMSSTSLTTYAINVGGIAGGSVADAAIINTSAAKATISVTSADALVINTGSLVGLHGSTVTPAYATLKNCIGEADITVDAGLCKVGYDGATGIDNIDYSKLTKGYYTSRNSTVSISYKESVPAEEEGGEATTKAVSKTTENYTITNVEEFDAATFEKLGFSEKVSDFFKEN